MEVVALTALKLILFTFGSLGIVFHLLVLISPEEGKKMEQALGTKFGARKKFVSWLEKDRTGLHERLMKSKVHNVCALIFLIILFVLLLQI